MAFRGRSGGPEGARKDDVRCRKRGRAVRHREEGKQMNRPAIVNNNELTMRASAAEGDFRLAPRGFVRSARHSSRRK
jgi:hypothetical protein